MRISSKVVFIISLAVNSLYSLNAFSIEQKEQIKIESGIYEGINEDSFYQVFRFSKNGKHQFFEIPIAKGLEKYRVHNFTDSNLTCELSECVIKINHAYFPNEVIKFTFMPYIDRIYSVLRATIIENKQAINSNFYRVTRKKKTSTPRDFLQRYHSQIESEKERASDGIYGFWVGTSNYNGSTHLTSLHVREDEKSEFVIFINGMGFTNEMSFNSNDIELLEEQYLKVSIIDKNVFSPQLIMHMKREEYIQGHFFQYHSGNPISIGNFELRKMK